MPDLKPWSALPVGGTVVRDEAVQPETGGWRTGADAAGRPQRLRELPPLLALLSRLGGRARRNDVRRFRLVYCKGCEICAEVCPWARSRWCADERLTASAQLLTGGEAAAHAMRQIDPDVVPRYPITPQTPIIQSSRSSSPTAERAASSLTASPSTRRCPPRSARRWLARARSPRQRHRGSH